MSTPALDIATSLDSVAKVLGVLTASAAVATAVAQAALPAVLRRREKWLREAMSDEPDESRARLLRELHVETSAGIVAGILVPGWRFLTPMWLLFVGVAQFFLLTRNTPPWWIVALAFLGSLAVVAIPIRRAIRLLCERARVAYEFRSDRTDVTRPRLGSLSQMEGGTRREFRLALASAFCINLIAVGVVLWMQQITLAGFITAMVGVMLLWWCGEVIVRYVRSRERTDGPWSTDNASL